MQKSKVNADGLVGDFFHNGSGERRKTVILLGGSEGGMFWSRVRPLLGAFLERGNNLLSLAYFKTPGLPDTLEEIPLEYFKRAFGWLDAQPEVFPGFYALVGASKGGELALLLGSRYPAVRAVVALNPSSVVWQGIPRSRFRLGQGGKSSWSYQGNGCPICRMP